MLFFIYSLRSLSHDQEKRGCFFIKLLRSLRHDQKKKSFIFIYVLRSLRQDQGTKKFFSFSHYFQESRKKKIFFQLFTTITTAWSREKKVFFSFSYYDQYAMIKRENSFFLFATKFTNEEIRMSSLIKLLPSLCHYQEKKGFLFHLATTITTPWSREKKFFSVPYYDHYAIIKREESFFI